MVPWTFNNIPLLDPQTLARQLRRVPADLLPENLGMANRLISRRGRLPTVGYVLLSWENIQTLSVGDTPYTLKVGNQSFPGLFVVSTRAVLPSLVAANTFADQVPYLVELADARHFWPLTPGRLTSENYAYASTDYATILNALWSDISSASLTIASGSVPAYLSNVHNFDGLSAWDAFCEVLDTLGLTIYPTPGTTGFTVAPLTAAALPTDQATELASALANLTLGTHGTFPYPLIPEVVEVRVPSADFQFDAISRSPEQHWEDAPFRIYSYNATSLLPASDHPFILAGTTLTVWLESPYQTDDVGSITNSADLITRTTDYAARVLRRHTNIAYAVDHTFSGSLNLHPSQTYATVTRYDNADLDNPLEGPGTKTRVSVGRPTEPPTPPDSRPPFDLYAHRPYHRQAYGIVGGSSTVALNESVSVDIIAFTVGGGSQTPGTVFTDTAYNATGHTLEPGDQVVLRWNYQPSTGGVWEIIGGPQTVGSGGGYPNQKFSYWNAVQGLSASMPVSDFVGNIAGWSGPGAVGADSFLWTANPPHITIPYSGFWLVNWSLSLQMVPNSPVGSTTSAQVQLRGVFGGAILSRAFVEVPDDNSSISVLSGTNILDAAGVGTTEVDLFVIADYFNGGSYQVERAEMTFVKVSEYPAP